MSTIRQEPRQHVLDNEYVINNINTKPPAYDEALHANGSTSEKAENDSPPPAYGVWTTSVYTNGYTGLAQEQSPQLTRLSAAGTPNQCAFSNCNSAKTRSPVLEVNSRRCCYKVLVTLVIIQFLAIIGLITALAIIRTRHPIDYEYPPYAGCGEYTYFPNPDDCGKFYKGVEDMIFSMSCPYGLYFNEAIQLCDFPHNVSCSTAPNTNGNQDLTFTSAGDNEHWVYADGQELGHHDDWTKTLTVTVPYNTKVIAVMIIDYGVIGGLLGSFSDGRVTDSSWKCTRNYFNQWQLATFDDRAWPAAEASREQGDVNWGIHPNIASNAKWIWAGRYVSAYKNTIVYCRKKLV